VAYLLLILEPGVKRRTRSPEEGRLAYERMLTFTEDLKARGLHKASDALRSDSEGVRVEVRDGKRTILDGPFAESKEIVGGFFLIDCGTKEQAIGIAKECPAAEWATVEVREVGVCFDDAS
jgi:hypothetical protein